SNFWSTNFIRPCSLRNASLNRSSALSWSCFTFKTASSNETVFFFGFSAKSTSPVARSTVRTASQHVQRTWIVDCFLSIRGQYTMAVPRLLLKKILERLRCFRRLDLSQPEDGLLANIKVRIRGSDISKQCHGPGIAALTEREQRLHADLRVI